MTEVHRVDDTNNAGAKVTSSLQSSVYAGNPPKLIAVDGSPVAGHGTGVHASPKTANGDSSVQIDNIPVNSKGDADTCGHTRDTGESSVIIGPE